MASQSISLTSYTEFPEAQASVSQKLLVMAHLKAPELHLPEGKERPPISVSAVIDKSGSMEGAKLELTKATLRFVVASLTDKDEFGIIAYSSTIQEVLKLQRMDAQGRRRAVEAVDSIHTDGCTNLSGGLFAGIDQLKGVSIKEGQPNLQECCFQTTRQNANSNFRFSFSNAVSNMIPDFFRPRIPPQPPIAVQSGQPGSVILLIGNGSETASSNAEAWYLFVRLEDTAPGAVEDHVAKVEFELPAAGGATQRLTVPTAPFQLSRTGRSGAEVRVHVTLTAPHGGATHTFNYTPNFASPLTYTTVQVPTASTGTTPTIITTPPSQPAGFPKASNAAHNEVVAVWLFTDGLANEGIRDREELVQATKDHLQGMAPACNVFTFGFGADHDAQLLKDVADAGHGMCYFVENEGAIARSFADCLGGLMSMVAKGLKLTATPVAGVTVHRVFTKFEHERSPTLAWVKIADLYSEEERDVILEIEVPVADPPNPAPAPVLLWRLEYQNLLTDSMFTAEEACMLARPVEAQPSPPHPLLDQQRNRIRCTDAIEKAKQEADQRNLPAARARLQRVMASVETSPSGQAEYCQGLVQDMRECLANMDNEAQYKALGTKVMLSNVHSHGQQRSSGTNTYRTASKTAMMQRFSS